MMPRRLCTFMAGFVAISCLSVLPGCLMPSSVLGCHAAIDIYWPTSSQPKAHHVAMRESHETATAQNKRSTAAGCFQLLKMHADLFARLGYSWGDRYNASANVQAAALLFKGSGWRPWALTA